MSSKRDPIRVLLVNCSEDERLMYSDYLRFDGVETLEAADVAAATTLATTERPDVVVTDLGVPSEADGLQLIRSLRSHGATTEVPIIVVSGRVFAIEQQRAFEAGCDVFLPKPLLPDALAHEVRRTVAAKRRATFKADEAQ